MSKPISRATFLLGTAGLAAAALSGKTLYSSLTRSALPPCRMLGPSMAMGHKLRDHASLPPPDPTKAWKTKVAIVGGGIAGLSAGWWLKRNNFDDFVILELENSVGGNSSSGRNEISPFPWGAHYVPLANSESKYVHMLFDECGVTTGTDANGALIYNELYLCHDPQERLYKDGTFEEGLVPRKGLQPKDKEQIARFFKTIRDLRATVGSDGKPAFAIPLELSSQDSQFLKLDSISMQQWLADNKFDSKPLRWYVNYCCRDDYGSTAERVSAWAGLHYFAGRRGTAANAESNSVVTWPEGNGFLVNHLRGKLADHIHSNTAVARISKAGTGSDLLCVVTTTHNSFAVDAETVIMSIPRFIAKRLLPSAETSFQPPQYAPWIVANVSLKHPPRGSGSHLAWDNVRYNSESLGYVVATHQNLSTRQGPTVITYYHPLSAESPQSARALLSEAKTDDWAERILKDLEFMHPGIRNDVVSIDLWPWGHGMVSPGVGYIWGQDRRAMCKNDGNIYFAHSDMSGISNFEEAQYRGVQAAQQILSTHGVRKA